MIRWREFIGELTMGGYPARQAVRILLGILGLGNHESTWRPTKDRLPREGRGEWKRRDEGGQEQKRGPNSVRSALYE